MQKKRIIYQAMHRGCKEADIILGRFATKNIDTLTPQELDIFEKMLTLDDELILNWIIGKENPPEKFREIVEKITIVF